MLVVAGLLASVAYFWQMSQDNQSQLAAKDEEIQKLSGQVASLQESSTKPASTDTNIIVIRELGISITVPDSIKDLTYAYRSYKDTDGKYYAGSRFLDTVAD